MLEEQIRKRLKEGLSAAQSAGKFRGPADLARLVSSELEQRAHAASHDSAKVKRTISAQTASNWVNGKVIPDWDVLSALSAVIGESEDSLLFGTRRGEQLKKERSYLSRINEDEGALLTAYREASKNAQKSILKMARTLADDSPAPEAQVHPLRRKDDKLKS